MKCGQKGFGLVGVVMALLVLCLVGTVAWLVHQRHENSQSQRSTVVKKSDFKVPDGWKTIAEKGVAVSYPKAWDETHEQRLEVLGKVQGGTLSVGFGSPNGYRYEGKGAWIYVDSGGSKVDDRKPEAAPAVVVGADATIIVRGADGGCGGSRLGFVYKDSLYAINLPGECDPATHESAGISGEVVARDLEQVIKSVRLQ